MSKAFFIDTSRCTACRGCQVACKQWHKHPATETKNTGSYQNPPDLNFTTYKLVRFEEQMIGGNLRWLFFADQCRHCIDPPCKLTADMYAEGAIIQDPLTGAVLYTDKTALLDKTAQKDVRESCPWDIPRSNENYTMVGKCDMCIDRVHNGLKPACVQVCPTGTMNFGDREDMTALAKARLSELKSKYPKAQLLNADIVNTIFLVQYPPELYHEFAVAEAKPRKPEFSRKDMFAKVLSPMRKNS
jgi:formate dehydrogenase iron-sulfur subunit